MPQEHGRLRAISWCTDRYSGASQVRLGSDGLSATGQLSPLVNNPKAPPTLVTGNVHL